MFCVLNFYHSCYLVVDADGIWVLQQDLGAVAGYDKCVITPNYAEFNRLLDSIKQDIAQCKNIVAESSKSGNESSSVSNSEFCSRWGGEGAKELEEVLNDIENSSDELSRVRGASKYLGVTIVRKGPFDIVATPQNIAFEIDEPGSPRRCGGQGDLMTGVLGVSLFWSLQKSLQAAADVPDVSVYSDEDGSSKPPASPSLLATVLASVVVRRSAVAAFKISGRSTTAVEILKHIPSVFMSDIEPLCMHLSDQSASAERGHSSNFNVVLEPEVKPTVSSALTENNINILNHSPSSSGSESNDEDVSSVSSVRSESEKSESESSDNSSEDSTV